MIRRREKTPGERPAALRPENRNRRLFASPLGAAARRVIETLRRKKSGGDEKGEGHNK